MTFRRFASPRSYWLEAVPPADGAAGPPIAHLRLSAPADVPAGATSWDYAAATADVPAFYRFLAQAIVAGLPRDEARRITLQVGCPTI